MPFRDIDQPEFITISETLRLRKYDGNYQLAIPWYQDALVRRFSEGLTDEKKVLGADYVAKN